MSGKSKLFKLNIRNGVESEIKPSKKVQTQAFNISKSLSRSYKKSFLIFAGSCVAFILIVIVSAMITLAYYRFCWKADKVKGKSRST